MIRQDALSHVLSHSSKLDMPLLLSFYDSKFSLLLNISQSRAGAVHVMNAGLFTAVRASTLLSVDPDLGIGMLKEKLQATTTDRSRNG